MKLNLENAQVETFDKMPARQRPVGTGKKSELLERVRKLKPKETLKFSLGNEVSQKEVSNIVKAVNAALSRKGALGFRPRVFVNMTENKIEIYRDHGSDWAMKNGEFEMSDTGRRQTVADLGR